MTFEKTASWFAFVGTVLMASVASAQTAAPARAKERDRISIHGTVVSTQPNSFRLDYGKGIITVEVPGWNWLREGRELIDDHRVTVYGRVDKSMQEQRRLVAIDVSQLRYNPLDDEGFQQLDVGDRIRVVGRLESAYFAANSLVAERIISVQQLSPSPG